MRKRTRHNPIRESSPTAHIRETNGALPSSRNASNDSVDNSKLSQQCTLQSNPYLQAQPKEVTCSANCKHTSCDSPVDHVQTSDSNHDSRNSAPPSKHSVSQHSVSHTNNANCQQKQDNVPPAATPDLSTMPSHNSAVSTSSPDKSKHGVCCIMGCKNKATIRNYESLRVTHPPVKEHCCDVLKICCRHYYEELVERKQLKKKEEMRKERERRFPMRHAQPAAPYNGVPYSPNLDGYERQYMNNSWGHNMSLSYNNYSPHPQPQPSTYYQPKLVDEPSYFNFNLLGQSSEKPQPNNECTRPVSHHTPTDRPASSFHGGEKSHSRDFQQQRNTTLPSVSDLKRRAGI